MFNVYKFPVSFGKFDLELPLGAKVLSVQMQYGNAQMWVLLDPLQRQRQTRRFLLTGTGHDIKIGSIDQLQYISTIQAEQGTLIWHIFEIVSLGD